MTVKLKRFGKSGKLKKIPSELTISRLSGEWGFNACLRIGQIKACAVGKNLRVAVLAVTKAFSREFALEHTYRRGAFAGFKKRR